MGQKHTCRSPLYDVTNVEKPNLYTHESVDLSFIKSFSRDPSKFCFQPPQQILGSKSASSANHRAELKSTPKKPNELTIIVELPKKSRRVSNTPLVPNPDSLINDRHVSFLLDQANKTNQTSKIRHTIRKRLGKKARDTPIYSLMASNLDRNAPYSTKDPHKIPNMTGNCFKMTLKGPGRFWKLSHSNGLPPNDSDVL